MPQRRFHHKTKPNLFDLEITGRKIQEIYEQVPISIYPETRIFSNKKIRMNYYKQ